MTEARGDECQKCGASYEATDLIPPLQTHQFPPHFKAHQTLVPPLRSL